MSDSTFLMTLSDAAFHLRRAEDQGLVGLISRAIRQQTHSVIHDLQVIVSPNSIQLTGQCVSFYTKQLAQEIARRYCQQRSLSNDIEVVVPQPR